MIPWGICVYVLTCKAGHGMGAANASITRLFVYVFPPRGPSRSQPVAWPCRFVLVSRWGCECPSHRDVLCHVPCPGPAAPVRAVRLPRGWTLPVDSRFPSSSEPNKTMRECQVSATIRSLPAVLLPPNPTGSDLWYFSERRFWPHFIFHRLLFLCMMLLFSYVSFFKRFWFIYCLSSYVLFPVFCTFLFISVPNHLKSLQKSG